jgi:hypothetical protein
MEAVAFTVYLVFGGSPVKVTNETYHDPAAITFGTDLLYPVPVTKSVIVVLPDVNLVLASYEMVAELDVTLEIVISDDIWVSKL